ncbi:unnamed protein product [Lymnaea stagnalis]|uniref:C-type lectin domain-containing protein n=1 Tax=Lymnaea stagnalis TaxID=6523 RepID=A0AAV2HIZ2_LYMST
MLRLPVKSICAYFIEIDHQAENDEVAELVWRQYNYAVRIGGTDTFKEGYWEFERTGQSMKYLNWCFGEPTNYVDEYCLGYLLSKSCMVDLECYNINKDYYFQYLCESN